MGHVASPVSTDGQLLPLGGYFDCCEHAPGMRPGAQCWVLSAHCHTSPVWWGQFSSHEQRVWVSLVSILASTIFFFFFNLGIGDRTQVLGALADGSHLFHYSYPHGCKAGHLTSFPPSCMLEMEPGASCKLGKTCTPGLQCFSFVFFFSH